MSKRNLRDFDPAEIAKFDARMWQAYYRHRFVRLFFILVRFAYKIHKDFGLSYFDIIKAAFWTAYSAMDFRLNKGKENKERITRKLIKAFKILERYSEEKFDYKKAAMLEVEWWLIDRYPKKYLSSREQGIALAMASVYNIEPEKLAEYASYRAEAMTLQDLAEEQGQTADWVKIESLLEKSFTALYRALHQS